MIVVLACDSARRMVQHTFYDLISNAHLAKTGCERASQIMSADIENAIVVG